MGDVAAKLAQREAAATFASEFIARYLDPAFGAKSKSEIDLLVFACLVKAGAINPSGPLYDIARSLNITPARVRGLVLNWQLRTTSSVTDLKKELIAALQETRFAKDGTLMTFGVENPLLREEIVARLKRRGVYADGSFSGELVRLPIEAFVDFLDELVDEDTKQALKLVLIKDKQLADPSFKALMIGVLGKLGEKAAGEVGKEIAGAVVGDVADKVVKPAIERITGFLTHLLRGDAGGAAETLVASDLA